MRFKLVKLFFFSLACVYMSPAHSVMAPAPGYTPGQNFFAGMCCLCPYPSPNGVVYLPCMCGIPYTGGLNCDLTCAGRAAVAMGPKLSSAIIKTSTELKNFLAAQQNAMSNYAQRLAQNQATSITNGNLRVLHINTLTNTLAEALEKVTKTENTISTAFISKAILHANAVDQLELMNTYLGRFSFKNNHNFFTINNLNQSELILQMEAFSSKVITEMHEQFRRVAFGMDETGVIQPEKQSGGYTEAILSSFLNSVIFSGSQIQSIHNEDSGGLNSWLSMIFKAEHAELNNTEDSISLAKSQMIYHPIAELSAHAIAVEKESPYAGFRANFTMTPEASSDPGGPTAKITDIYNTTDKFSRNSLLKSNAYWFMYSSNALGSSIGEMVSDLKIRGLQMTLASLEAQGALLEYEMLSKMKVSNISAMAEMAGSNE